jgi:hypothetical protein
MFISRRAHDLIVAAVMASANERLAELRNQIAELKKERDFYRKEWTKSRGQAFPSPAPAQAEAPMPLFDQRSPAEPEALDANWSVDDRDLFKEWSLNLGEGVNAEEEYKRIHGSSPPLIALTV